MNRHSTSQLVALAILGSVVGLLPGCMCLPLARVSSALKSEPRLNDPKSARLFIQQQAETHPVPRASNSGTPTAGLAPFPGRQGVLVCEPVVDPAHPADADLGTACGRWLLVTIAGQGELGRTPLLGSIDRIPAELKREDLRLRPEDLSQLGGKLDVTRVATGELKGDPGHRVLTYRWWEFPSQAAVGPPVTISGTDAELVGLLPGMARQLLSQVGVAHPRLPSAIPAGVDEFRRVGRSLGNGPQNAEDLKLLRGLAAKVPLAGLAYLRATAADPVPDAHSLYVRLLDQEPQNAAVLGAVGWGDAAALAERDAACTAMARRFPQNNQLAHVEVWLRRLEQRYAAELAAAQRTVRCAPADPDAWLSLADTASRAADRVRHARTADAIRSDEWPVLEQNYRIWLHGARRATELDPLHGRAWLRLATAATFASDPRLAEAAFWRALALNGDRQETLAWGLQMFQPKWGGRPQTLESVARLAALEPLPQPWRRVELAQSIRDAGLPKIADDLLSQLESESRAAIQKSPRDADAHFTLGLVLREQGRLKPASREFAECVRIQPAASGARFELAKTDEKLNQARDAVAQYREVLRLRPDHAEARAGLARALSACGEYPAALTAFRDAEAHGDRSEDLYVNWSILLGEKKQFAEGVRVCERGIAAHPMSSRLHTQLGYLYASDKQHEKAVRECRSALALDPDDSVAHENLGDELAEMHQLEPARREWNWVIQHDPNGGNAQEAKEMLARYGK